MAANQAILDATIRHAVFLEKLKAGEVGKFAPFLKEIDRSIRDRLTQSDLTEYNVKRLEALLKEVDSLLLGIFDRYSTQLNLDLIDIANYEAEFEATSLAKSAPVGVSLDVVAPTAAAIRTAVLTNPLSVRGTGGGKLLKAFIKGWTSAERERVTGAIRQGFFEGQTNFQIIRNIRGTRLPDTKMGFWPPPIATPVRSCTPLFSMCRPRRAWRWPRRTRTSCPRSKSLQRWTARPASNAGHWMVEGFRSSLAPDHRFTRIVEPPSSC